MKHFSQTLLHSATLIIWKAFSKKVLSYLRHSSGRNELLNRCWGRLPRKSPSWSRCHPPSTRSLGARTRRDSAALSPKFWPSSWERRRKVPRLLALLPFGYSSFKPFQQRRQRMSWSVTGCERMSSACLWRASCALVTRSTLLFWNGGPDSSLFIWGTF